MTTSEQHGSFNGDVAVIWNEDDHRTMTLTTHFSFTDQKRTWHVPEGARIDGASIPQWLWTFVGAPFVGRYRRASVIHDYFCQRKTASWQDVHKLFHQACLADGVGALKAQIMYWAVYLFGPRWSEDEASDSTLLETFYGELFPRRIGLG